MCSHSATTRSMRGNRTCSECRRLLAEYARLARAYTVVFDAAVTASSRSQSDVANVARALGMGGPATAIGAPTDPGGSSMFQAVEQFGLRLDSHKEQIETLVIDHIEKLPTAN